MSFGEGINREDRSERNGSMGSLESREGAVPVQRVNQSPISELRDVEVDSLDFVDDEMEVPFLAELSVS